MLKSKSGYALIVILLALLVIGFVVMKMNGGSNVNIDSKGEVVREPSMPKQLINRANDAVEKHDKAQASSEQAYKDLGLE